MTRFVVGPDGTRYKVIPNALPDPQDYGSLEPTETQCPRCFGKGLENQDDRPGLLLEPLGEMECRQCGGTGKVTEA